MGTIGVLALQGGFEAHQKALQQAGADSVQVRTRTELESVSALIIPGGESTTMLKILLTEDLLEPLRRFGAERPVFGTCAGAILLAKEVTSPAQESLGLVDMTIERNAYGRQLDSHVASLQIETGLNGSGLKAPVEAVFIRAPIIRRIGPAVKMLLSYRGDPVLVEQGRHLAATFHPELSPSAQIHRLFLEKLV